MAKYLVFDIGGTFIKYALSDEEGNLTEHGKVPTPHTTAEDFFKVMGEIGDQYKDRIEACAVSMPGKIDTDKGISVSAGALTHLLRGCHVGEILSERFGCPVTVGNDGKCAAAAEAWKGAVKDYANGLVIVMGTATGGGVIIDHRVYLGTTFTAGELSHFIYDQPAITAGYDPHTDLQGMFRGSPYMMSYASANGYIIEYMHRKGLTLDQKVSGEEFFAKVRERDADACGTLQYVSKAIASSILALQAVLDVGVVAIGGGISEAPELIEAIREETHDAFVRHMDSFPLTEPAIVRCCFGADANLIGALKLHMEQTEKKNRG